MFQKRYHLKLGSTTGMWKRTEQFTAARAGVLSHNCFFQSLKIRQIFQSWHFSVTMSQIQCTAAQNGNWIYRNLPAPKTANNTRRVCKPRIPEQCVRCLEQGLCVQELPQVIVRGSWQRAHEPPVCFRQSRPSPTAVVVPRNLGTVALPKPLAALMTWAAWVHHSGICYRFCLACACRLLSSWLLLFISGLYISVLIIIVMSCSGLWRWSLSSPT